ncbi:hypothetical protein J6590_028518 [Homalodisca vitripennis]|nr:hypothetical protein J6590_028518 [Homalodisca vitripennis]
MRMRHLPLQLEAEVYRRELVLRHMCGHDCQLHLFYDPRSVREAIAHISSDLDNVIKWSVENGLQLNVHDGFLHVFQHNLVQPLIDWGVGFLVDGLLAD